MHVCGKVPRCATFSLPPLQQVSGKHHLWIRASKKHEAAATHGNSRSSGHHQRLSQDELRKKLAKTWLPPLRRRPCPATFDELRVMKGPNGYALSDNGDDEDDDMPGIKEVLFNFGMEVKQAQNLTDRHHHDGRPRSPLQPRSIYEDWPELMGSIAGDDTVLVICADSEQAAKLKTRMEGLIG